MLQIDRYDQKKLIIIKILGGEMKVNFLLALLLLIFVACNKNEEPVTAKRAAGNQHERVPVQQGAPAPQIQAVADVP